MDWILFENWRPVVGYRGLYEVSDLGRVRTLKIGKGCNPKKFNQPISLTKRKNGYLWAELSDDFGNRHPYKVHILVMAAFVGPAPKGYEIDHKYGNKLDNRLSQLEYVTNKENIRRAFALGLRDSKGENNPKASLTQEEVIEIRKLLQTQLQREIAELFGVHPTTISRIARGDTWLNTNKEFDV